MAVLLGFLLVTNPVVADAAGQITGAQIKDNSVTGKDVAESSLGTVPTAMGLAPLKSGQSESGVFSGAAVSAPGSGGYLSFGITYPRPLVKAIAESKIIDTDATPDAVHCPGPGHAAKGYLCLYFQSHLGLEGAYGHTRRYPYSETVASLGVAIFMPAVGDYPVADGVWTVTAP